MKAEITINTVTPKTTYKVYKSHDDFAVELNNGKWRVLEYDVNGNCEVKTYDHKPERFQKSILMTHNDMNEATLFDLFEEIALTKGENKNRYQLIEVDLKPADMDS